MSMLKQRPELSFRASETRTGIQKALDVLVRSGSLRLPPVALLEFIPDEKRGRVKNISSRVLAHRRELFAGGLILNIVGIRFPVPLEPESDLQPNSAVRGIRFNKNKGGTSEYPPLICAFLG